VQIILVLTRTSYAAPDHDQRGKDLGRPPLPKQQDQLKAAVAKRAHEQDDEIVKQEAGLADTFAKAA